MSVKFRIGISARVLFDLEKEHEIYLKEGLDAYINYQIAHESEVLAPGSAFGVVKSFLNCNSHLGNPAGEDKSHGTKDKANHIADEDAEIEVIIMSKNNADISLRLFHSIAFYGLDIKRAAFSAGRPIAPYLSAYDIDLYLSYSEEEVSEAIRAGIAAAVVLERDYEDSDASELKIAFDGDCVLFSDEAEDVFKSKGIEGFCESERSKALIPLKPGPFYRMLKALSMLSSYMPIRTALVTSRCAPAHERAVRTLRHWGLRVDEAFFLGGVDKSAILKAFDADIFFDDNEENLISSRDVVLSAKVPIIKVAS